MKICTQCGACFDDGYERCGYDGAELQSPFMGPRVLGDRYLLEQRLAQGAMGQVFRATHLQIGSTVAVKIMQPQKEALRVALARFHREAQTLGQIKHPNAILVMDFGVDERDERSVPYLVTEYLQGISLHESLQTQEEYSLLEALDIMAPLCEAIAELHELGIVHRDIKPSNIFLENLRDGTQVVKVLDFGIAKFLEYSETRLSAHPEVRDIFDMVSENYFDTELEVTPLELDGEEEDWGDGASEPTVALELTVIEQGQGSGMLGSQEDWALTGADLVVGTVPFMAPEQLTGEPISPQTDIYALGTLVYKMLSGRFPFTGTHREIATSKLNEIPPSLVELGVPVNELFSQLIDKTLSLSPNARPRDAMEIVKAIKEALAQDQQHPLDYSSFEQQVLLLQNNLDILVKAVSAWVERIADEDSYRWSRDALLSLDKPIENVLFYLEQATLGAEYHELARLRKPAQKISWSVEKLSRLLYGLASEHDHVVEYTSYLSTLWSRITLSLDYICSELMEHASNHTPMISMTDSASANPFQSSITASAELMRQLINKIVAADVLENVEAFERLLNEHRDLLFSCLAKPETLAPEVLSDLVSGLWRQAPDLLLLELYPAEKPLHLLSLLAELKDVEDAKGFQLLSSLFEMTSDGDDIISRVQLLVEYGSDPKYQRLLLRCLVLHHEASVSAWAISLLERSELWHVISYSHAPLSIKKVLFENVVKDAPPEYLKVFFFCVRPNVFSAQRAEELFAAFEILELFFKVSCFHEDMIFEPLLALDQHLRALAMRLKLQVQEKSPYQDLLTSFMARGSQSTRDPESMREIPLPIQRKIARDGHFLSFFVSHSNDKVALETLPHLYKKEDITRYLRIPTINRLVLTDLAKRRRFFRKEMPRLALLQNPKTHAQVARIYLPLLSEHQVRLLAENKHISGEVRKMARKFVKRRREKRNE